MLYILPPPTNPSPPSVWDLIINFHRKGCQDSETVIDSSSSKSVKFICTGQQQNSGDHEKKIRRSWCKTTQSSSSTNHFNNVSERRDNEKRWRKQKSILLCFVDLKNETIVQRRRRSISLSRKNQM